MLGDVLGEKRPGAFAEFPFSSQKLPQSQLSKKDNLKSKEEIRYLRRKKQNDVQNQKSGCQAS